MGNLNPESPGTATSCFHIVEMFQGLDVMPVVSPATAENRPSLGQPTRLRVTGRTKLSGRLSPQPDQAVPSTQLPASAFEGETHTNSLHDT